MLRFFYPEILDLFYIIPLLLILIFIFYIFRKKRLISQFANKKVINFILLDKSYTKEYIKFFIFLLAISLIILAAARPQIGSKLEEVKIVGSDVFILLDVSNSMAAQDLKPNRLEQAKYEISTFIKKLQGDRVGLIVFAGDAFVQIPLTTDYQAANLFLESIDFDIVPSQGTSIAKALDLAIKSTDFSKNSKKVFILISDGEDHEGDLESVLSEIKSKNIVIYTIGMGSPLGSPIPILNSTGEVIGFKKDRDGNTVVTKLDEFTLKKLAEETDGKYFLATGNQNELDLIYKDLMAFEKAEFGNKKITEYEDKFYLFLIPALILLIIEILISDKRNPLFLNIFKKIQIKKY